MKCHPSASEISPPSQSDRAQARIRLCLFISVLNLIVSVSPAQTGTLSNLSDHWIPFRVPGKCGYIDSAGNYRIAPQFDEGGNFHGNVTWVRIGAEWNPPAVKNDWNIEEAEAALRNGYQGGRYGFINRAGEYVLRAEFDFVAPWSGGMWRVQRNGKWGFVDESGRVGIPVVYENAKDFGDGLGWVRYEGRWRLIGANNTFVATGDFDEVLPFQEGLARVQQNGKWGAISTTGQIAVAPRYDVILLFKSGAAPAAIGDRWGVIDKSGKELSRFVFTGISEFNEHGRAEASESSTVKGEIDTLGVYHPSRVNPAVKLERYETGAGGWHRYAIRPNAAWWRAVRTRSGPVVIPGEGMLSENRRRTMGAYRLYGFRDASNRLVIEPQFAWAGDFSGGLAWAWDDWRYGYRDGQGEVALEPQFHGAELFRDDRALVRMRENWGMIDRRGQYVIAPNYVRLERVDGGIVKASAADGDRRQRHGYFDADGRTIVPVDFHELGPIAEGIVKVGRHDETARSMKYGYFAAGGELFVPLILDSAEDYSEGLALCKVFENQTRYFGFLGKAGKWAFPPQPWSDAQSFSDGLAAIQTRTSDGKSKWGYIGTNGEWKIAAQFTQAGPFRSGVAAASIDGRTYGLIDMNGQWVLEPEFARADEPRDGMVVVSKVANPSGNILKGVFLIEERRLIEPQFQELRWMAEGLMAARMGLDWGYLDREGNVVVPFNFSYAASFHNGYALVRWSAGSAHPNKIGYIDKTGGFYEMPISDIQRWTSSKDLKPVKLGDQWGYAAEGEIEIAAQFEEAGEFENGRARVRLGGKTGIIDASGNFQELAGRN